MKRRDFISGVAITSASLAAGQMSKPTEASKPVGSGAKNILISSVNGHAYLDAGYEWLERGKDTLDAAITVVSGPENDPNDTSVGLGGLPTKRASSNWMPAACTARAGEPA